MEVVDWLLQCDVAVQYAAHRDLLGSDRPDLQARIATEGAGAALLAARGPDGHWGEGFFEPKWTSTHYTLLELRELGLPPDHPQVCESIELILRTGKGDDGGLNPGTTLKASDVCINAMALHYCAYFGADAEMLRSIVDFMLGQQLADGGFNCRSTRAKVQHSSVHTTGCVIEAVTTWLAAGYAYRAEDLARARDDAVEFLLQHRLFRSHRTGEVIHPELARLHHPPRWRFDVLRGLDMMRAAGVAHDPRMDDAIEVLIARRRSDGRWAAQRGYPGQTHLRPTPARQPDPWLTLKALRCIKTYR